MVYIHWRTATNNLGKRFDPPPFWAMPKFTWFFFLGGASLNYFVFCALDQKNVFLDLFLYQTLFLDQIPVV